MYASSGPVRTMPGSVSRVDSGTMCDEHPTFQAHKRVQGETDSFGCEYYYQCKICIVNDSLRQRENPSIEAGSCDWCKTHSPKLSHCRDFDEGMTGPVYRICIGCYAKELERRCE